MGILFWMKNVMMMKDGGRNRIIISEEGVFEKVAMTNKLLMSLDGMIILKIYSFSTFLLSCLMSLN